MAKKKLPDPVTDVKELNWESDEGAQQEQGEEKSNSDHCVYSGTMFISCRYGNKRKCK